MKEGWTKNLALLFARPWSIGCWRLSEFLLILSLLIGALEMRSITGLYGPFFFLLLLASIAFFFFWMRVRGAHFSMTSSAISIFGLPVFAYLLFRSARLRKSRGVSWKGREYRSAQSGAATPNDDKFSAALALFMTVQIPLFLAAAAFLAMYGHKIFHRH
jgi:hypothetical protein